MAENSGVEPKRRLDRSVDKKEFNTLPSQDRNLVFQLRNAMEGVHKKVEALQDGLDDRERDLHREQTLRRAAEERLDKLVDMYADPAVNQELRERLPRAAKTNNRDKWQAELDQINSLGKSRSFDDLLAEDSPCTGKSRSKSADGRKTHKKAAISDEECSDEEDCHGSRHLRRLRMPTATQYAVPPYPAYYPQFMMAPHPQMMYAFAAPPNTNTSQQTQGAEGSSTPSVAPSSAFLAKMKASCDDTYSSNGSVGKERELNRRLTMLLSELDAARELNEKLQEKLNTSERDLASAKVRLETREAELEAEHTGKITALVEEIYAAQKQRDVAMLERIRTANEERDEALLKLKHLHNHLEQLDLENLSEEINLKKLVNELRAADSCEGISRSGKALVEAINRTIKDNKQVSLEEMRAVLQDRDEALTQARRTEAEFCRLQRQMAARENQEEEQSTTYAKLLATQQERDIVLSKCQRLEEEIQTLQVYYSLHKSLSQEQALRDQFNESLDNLEDQLKDREILIQQVQRENNNLVEQIETAARDREQAMEELHAAHEAQKHSAANEMKLERLVNVLRRKIKGLGTADE